MADACQPLLITLAFAPRTEGSSLHPHYVGHHVQYAFPYLRNAVRNGGIVRLVTADYTQELLYMRHCIHNIYFGRASRVCRPTNPLRCSPSGPKHHTYSPLGGCYANLRIGEPPTCEPPSEPPMRNSWSEGTRCCGLAVCPASRRKVPPRHHR
jgi:hypothetical protein